VTEEKAPSFAKRWRAMILGVLPGAAHILVLDRAAVGAVFFVLFMVGVDAAVLGRWVLETSTAPDILMGGVFLAAAAWLAAFLDVARLVVFRDYRGRAEMRRRLCDEAIAAYALGNLHAARKCFRACLDLSARDPDVLFWYGVVEARRGKDRRARRSFKRCLKYDEQRKWEWECRRELVRMEVRVTVPSPPEA